MKKNEKAKQNYYLMLILFFLALILIIIFYKNFTKTDLVSEEISLEKAETQSPEEEKIFFASNGNDTAYKIKRGDKWAVIFNGVEGKLYDFVSNPVFSPDGTQLAYSAEIEGQAYVVLNNTHEIKAYKRGTHITFSQNGKVLAFIAAKESSSFVVIKIDIPNLDISEGDEFDQIGFFKDSSGNSVALALSFDGNQIAYAVKIGDKVYIVVNGQAGEKYDNILNFSFSSDGSQFAYQAESNGKILTIIGNKVVSVSSGSNTNSNQTSENPSSISNPQPSSETYKYKISTQKDVSRDQDEMNYSDCPEGTQCNF